MPSPGGMEPPMEHSPLTAFDLTPINLRKKAKVEWEQCHSGSLDGASAP